MSDYFLNRVYDSLLANKLPKTKSTFRTLSESYNLVYEQGPFTTTPTNSTQNIQQQTQPTPTQPAITQQENKEYSPDSLPTKFNVKAATPTRILWTPYQRQLFNESAKTGTGRGETAIANVISGIDDINILERMVSGQSLSYDVSWPPIGMFNDSKKHAPTFKFEVKELEYVSEKEKKQKAKATVRIGVEGRGFAVESLSKIEQAINFILDEYSTLSEAEQKIVDNEIIEKVVGSALQEPGTQLRKFKGTQVETQASIEKKKIYNRYKNWSLSRYLILVKDSADRGELPPTILFGRPNEPVSTNFPGEKQDLFLLSLKRLFEIINTTKEADIEVQTAIENPRITSLKDLFYKNYLPPETETNKDVIQDVAGELSKKAKIIDRDLIKLKAKKTGEKFTAKEFFKEIKSLQLLSFLEKLQSSIYGTNALINLFPSDLTGFFAVNRNGYIYIPREDIPKFLEFNTFSSGGVKVHLAKQ